MGSASWPLRVALVLGIMAATMVVAWSWWPPTTRQPVAPAGISSWAGKAYSFALDRGNWFVASRSDSPEAPDASTLALFEDGRRIGPPHSPHQGVADSGGGRYSHWRNEVVFSASDSSDPRVNGRRYEARYPLLPAPWLLWLSIAILVAVPAIAASRFLLTPPRWLATAWRFGSAAIVAALFAAASLATLTHWLPIRGEVVAVPADPAGPGTGGETGEPASAQRVVPFERLVAPFLIVPSGDDANGSHVRMTWGGTVVREVFDEAEWLAATDAVFLDGDRIRGDGLLVRFPHGSDPGRGPAVVSYRAVVTGGAIGFLWAAFGVACLSSFVVRRTKGKPPLARALLAVASALGAAGIGLAVLSLVGTMVPQRPAQPRLVFLGPETGLGDGGWIAPEALERELPPRAGELRQDYAVRMNELVAAHVKHIWNYANASSLRLHVPPWSNYVLWALGEMDPKLYRYHYAAWRPALERGAGMCAQVTLILVGILREQGYDARIVQLSGHTVVTAEVTPGTWYVLDPDVGVVLRQGLAEIEGDPESVRAAYERAYERGGHLDPKSAAALMVGFYGRDGNSVESRDGNEMLGEDWGRRERLAERLKWLIPLALLAISVALAGTALRSGRVPPPAARLQTKPAAGAF